MVEEPAGVVAEPARAAQRVGDRRQAPAGADREQRAPPVRRDDRRPASPAPSRSTSVLWPSASSTRSETPRRVVAELEQGRPGQPVDRAQVAAGAVEDPHLAAVGRGDERGRLRRLDAQRRLDPADAAGDRRRTAGARRRRWRGRPGSGLQRSTAPSSSVSWAIDVGHGTRARRRSRARARRAVGPDAEDLLRVVRRRPSDEHVHAAVAARPRPPAGADPRAAPVDVELKPNCPGEPRIAVQEAVGPDLDDDPASRSRPSAACRRASRQRLRPHGRERSAERRAALGVERARPRSRRRRPSR